MLKASTLLSPLWNLPNFSFFTFILLLIKVRKKNCPSIKNRLEHIFFLFSEIWHPIFSFASTSLYVSAYISLLVNISSFVFAHSHSAFCLLLKLTPAAQSFTFLYTHTPTPSSAILHFSLWLLVGLENKTQQQQKPPYLDTQLELRDEALTQTLPSFSLSSLSFAVPSFQSRQLSTLSSTPIFYPIYHFYFSNPCRALIMYLCGVR